MKPLFFIASSIVFLVFAGTENSFAQTSYTAKRDITLKFNSDDGTNACAVAWHPDKKLYYSVIAGNETFPLEVFSESGKYVSGGEAGFDARSLWYNSKTGKLEGNGAGEVGLFSLDIGSDGKPGTAVNVYSGQKQPDFQSVGALNPAKQIIYYYNAGTVYTYKRKGGKASKTFEIKAPVGVSNLNTTTVVFTGRKGEELGLLDKEEGKVYLFDLKGNHTASVTLPSGSETPDMFRFSCANGKIWVYDVGTRSWTGYTF